jgi:hypothetical protein
MGCISRDTCLVRAEIERWETFSKAFEAVCHGHGPLTDSSTALKTIMIVVNVKSVVPLIAQFE